MPRLYNTTNQGALTEEESNDKMIPPQLQRQAFRYDWSRFQNASAVSTTTGHGAAARTRKSIVWIALSLISVALGAAGIGAVSVPGAPARVNLDVLSGDEVAVSFSAPLSDGGSAVQSYEVRADSCF